MTLTEKTAFLKGMLEGMNIDKGSDNGKLFSAIIDAMDDIALSVSDIEEQTSIMSEELDIIEEALDEIDEVIDEMDDTLNDIYDEDDDDDDYEFDDDEFYQVVCPTCNEEISVDESILSEGKIKCPACGEDLEFDIEDEECCGEEGCTCGR